MRIASILLCLVFVVSFQASAQSGAIEDTIDAGRLNEARAALGQQYQAERDQERRSELALQRVALEIMRRGDFAAAEQIVASFQPTDHGRGFDRARALMAEHQPSAETVARLPELVSRSGAPSSWTISRGAARHTPSGLTCPADIPGWTIRNLTLVAEPNGARCIYNNPERRMGVVVSVQRISPQDDPHVFHSRHLSNALLTPWGADSGVLELHEAVLSLEEPGDLGVVYATQLAANPSPGFYGAGGVLLLVRGNWAIAVGITIDPAMFGFTSGAIVPALARSFIRSVNAN